MPGTAPGQVAYIAGTSTVILAFSDTLVLDKTNRYLVTPMAGLDGWGLEMDLLATGNSHAWLAGLLTGGDQTALATLADAADPEAPPLFLPYLLPELSRRAATAWRCSRTRRGTARSCSRAAAHWPRRWPRTSPTRPAVPCAPLTRQEQTARQLARPWSPPPVRLVR